MNSHKLEVRKSPIHGVGVFATEKIARGEALTRYFTDRVYKNGDPSPEWENWRDYGMRTACGGVFVGDPRVRDVESCGHLINEAYMPKISGPWDDFDTMLDTVIDYIRTTEKKRNVNLKPVVTAKRDIEPGEELLAAYGFNYWLGRKVDYNMDKVCDEIRVLCRIVQNQDIFTILVEMENLDNLKTFFKFLIEHVKEECRNNPEYFSKTNPFEPLAPKA